MKTIQLGAYDPERAKAKYVVEEIFLDDGINGYPERNNPNLFIVARRLKNDGSYNPNGQLIAFNYNDPRGHSVRNLKIEGQMKRTFN